MKIAVAGAGYVGLSLATLLAQNNEVTLLEIVPEKVKLINDKKSPIEDAEIKDFLAHKDLNLKATDDWKTALKDKDYIIIATPTNYDEVKNYFDTSSVEDIIKKYQKLNPNDEDTAIVIKSTIPVGYTNQISKKYHLNNIFFSPEFLREGHALYDNLYPSRIVIGSHSDKAKKFADLLIEGAAKLDIPVKFMNPTEAEAVKLFANTYLAVRVAYFNELDTYAERQNLNAKDIIEGVCLDPRIGSHYNNPSFGYGGYCLPKDTKQLRANYKDIPETLISAVIDANDIRKQHIADMVLAKKPKTVGIYRLTMKSGSDNFRSSAIQDIIHLLSNKDLDIIIYEPTLSAESFDGYRIENDLAKFKATSDIILANRIENDIKDIADKVYTRDLFARD